MIKRQWDRLSEEERRIIKDELIQYFENERDEKIGVIAADEILNFFLQTAGKKLYNKGVADAKKALNNRYSELSYDIDDLLEI